MKKNLECLSLLWAATDAAQIVNPFGRRSSFYTSPYHRWPFNGDVVDTGGGLQGVLHGNTSYSNDAYEGQKSLRLGCCNSSVTFDDYSLKEPFTHYTISIWFKEEKRTGKVRYLYEEGGAKVGIGLRLNGDSLEAAVVEGGGRENEKVASCGPIRRRKWNHATAVYSDGMLTVALDGTKNSTIDTGLGELGAHYNAASIGGGGLSHTSSDVRFVGLVDDFRIWDDIALTSSQIGDLAKASNKTNFLIIVADDLNGDSPSFSMGGGVAPDVTPNLDRLANESMVFELAHAATSVCQSSRQSMLSGRYPPNYGNVGFFPMANGIKTVVSSLRKAGYLTATFHKFWHMRPYSSFPWDMSERNTHLQGEERQDNGKRKKIGRSPRMLAQGLSKSVKFAKSTNKPFFTVVNSADPHRPFFGAEEDDRNSTEQMEVPSRIYTPDEVTVPPPLPDIPEIRKDVAMYASSVRRMDDAIGACLKVLEQEGVADNTVVIFVSDNGMPMPYGKFETYRDSLKGPMVVRWPSHIKPQVDSKTLVSLTDIAPTLLDIAKAKPLDGIDGRSLLPFFLGETNVPWRNVVVGTRYEDIYYGNSLAKAPDPEATRLELYTQGWEDANDHHVNGTMKRTMNKRGVTDGTYHYIYNHFYNASNKILAYPYGSETIWAMEVAARNDTVIAEQLEFYSYRTQEECYNVKTDPGFKQNLIGDAGARDTIDFLKNELLLWMQESNDPVVDDYQSFLSSRRTLRA